MGLRRKSLMGLDTCAAHGATETPVPPFSEAIANAGERTGDVPEIYIKRLDDTTRWRESWVFGCPLMSCPRLWIFIFCYILRAAGLPVLVDEPWHLLGMNHEEPMGQEEANDGANGTCIVPLMCTA